MITLKTSQVFEKKYDIPKRARNSVLSALGRYSGIPSRFAYAGMRTLYFDDEHNTSYHDSRNGHLDRRKFRFREYLDREPGGALYSLEIKNRVNEKTYKNKALVYKELPKDYDVTTYGDLIRTFEAICGYDLLPLIRECSGIELRPTLIISYERHRFDDRASGVRYNFDINIMMHFLTPTSQSGAFYLDRDVFEVKGDGPGVGLPRFFEDLPFEFSEFSKFIWGKELFL